ncbi:hypothetical protein FIU83_05105 [Halomonas sp. THAF5a]|uniref:HEPN domain-containing protein n=1 Tax=Halomonas sp. THAF5a TaxID=2587844 RepID=UPI0012689A63|nr:HEPN domain-containing protein [Halomonas sp. THAF5a]QFU01008.1 hypothetical protein FIU83_05105 [Halomonas sp. THAF5a]
MEPIEQFRVNIDAARKYLDMYRELRQLRNLGVRGPLNAGNKYLLWLPRASIVSSMSSLDAYVHQVLYRYIPQFLKQADSIPEKLGDMVVRVSPIKNASHVGGAIQYVRSPTGPERLADAIRENVLNFQAYQAPDKVVEAYRVIGVTDVIQEVADRWRGPNTDRGHIASRLERYAKRRNQIAHEGDLDNNHEPREITPELGATCVDFIENVVSRMDQISINPNQ